MNITSLILISSISVQAANVVLAVRMIYRTRRHLAGGLIIAAVILMVFRRAVALYHHLIREELQTDVMAESVALIISILFFIAILYVTKIIESETSIRREKDELIADLHAAIADIKTLEGIIPICASCKKIRDDRGSWNKLEKYISEHSNAKFSHGLCLECAQKLYPHLKSDLTKTGG